MKERRKGIRLRIHDFSQTFILLKIEGVIYKARIFDYSRFGLGVIATGDEIHSWKNNTYIEECIINTLGKEKLLGPGELVHQKKKKDVLFLGIYLEKEFVDMDFLFEKQSLALQEDERKRISMHFSMQEEIHPNFISFVSRFVYGLSLYKISLDDLDQKFLEEPEQLKEVLFSSITEGVGQDFYNFLSSSIEELKLITKSFSKLENERHGFYLRKSIWNFLMESEFIKRTNIKPRGYAGDSVMMEMLYNHEYLGKSSFGKIFHKHPCDTKAADAVRNRRSLINEFISEQIEKLNKEEVKILSVACGPAWEIHDFLLNSPYNRRVSFYLLDQDYDALEEAKTNISKIPDGGNPYKVNYIKESVRTLLRSSSEQIFLGQFDFIYSMGLYDYLTDSVATALTHKLFSVLNSSGMMILGNYHKENETRKYMEYLMDWVLYYREEESLLELIEGVANLNSSSVHFDNSGTQMFLKATKT